MKKYVRFLEKDTNKPQQDLIKSYLDEMIYSYGVDVRYWRKHIDTFQTPAISSEFYNHIYGELPDAPYNISGDMVVHLQINNDEWMMEQMGIKNAGSYTISFLCDAFTESFKQKIGTDKQSILSGSVVGYVPNNITGDLLNIKIPVSGEFFNDDVKFNITEQIPLSAYTKFIGTPDYVGVSPNSELYLPEYYENEVEISGSLSGSLNLYENVISGELSGSILSGNVSGIIDYKDNIAIMANPDWKLAPQVGDVFELLGLAEDLPSEQYEISRIYDKNLSDDEMNQMLGRYIFKCDCVRRESSHEDFNANGETKTTYNEIVEKGTNDNLWNSLEIEDISNSEMFDYKKPVDEETRTQDDVDIKASNKSDISSVYGNY